ncbi:Uncharacterised protein [Mycobacteroides abscessus subsp. abscessus]|nr:Uncharacterised protein [Mycobacteroides abscessus subsp. abscessus]
MPAEPPGFGPVSRGFGECPSVGTWGYLTAPQLVGPGLISDDGLVDEADRRQGAGAKSDVAQPLLCGKPNDEHAVGGGANCCGAHLHPALNAEEVEAEALQDGSKEGDVLVAVAAARAPQQLGLNGRDIQCDILMQHRIKILPLDVQDVAALQAAQGLQRRRPIAVEADKGQVFVELKLIAVPHGVDNVLVTRGMPVATPIKSGRKTEPIGSSSRRSTMRGEF